MPGSFWLEGPVFEPVRTVRYLHHILLTPLLSFLFVLFGQIIGLLPYLILLEPLQTQQSSQLSPLLAALLQAGTLISEFAPIILLLWLWLRFLELRSFGTLGFQRAGAARSYLRGLLLGFGCFSLVVLVAHMLGVLKSPLQPFQQSGSDWVLLGSACLLVYAGWAIQGAAEELVFRGWLLQITGARYRPWIGILLSAISFGMMHALNPGFSPLALLNLSLFGLFLALYRLQDNQLWGVFAWHAAWNWTQSNLFGLEVSGNNPTSATLFHFKIAGPDLLTGGRFGLEGGLTCTLSLLIGLSVLVFIGYKKNIDRMPRRPLEIPPMVLERPQGTASL